MLFQAFFGIDGRRCSSPLLSHLFEPFLGFIASLDEFRVVLHTKLVTVVQGAGLVGQMRIMHIELIHPLGSHEFAAHTSPDPDLFKVAGRTEILRNADCVCQVQYSVPAREGRDGELANKDQIMGKKTATVRAIRTTIHLE